MRHFFVLLLTLYLIVTPLMASFPIEIHGKAAVLLNGESNKILFSKEKDLVIYPASTTKVATALFLLEKFPHLLDEVAVGSNEALATISPQAKRDSNYRSPAYWLESDGVHMGIKRGEEMKVKDLLYALLIQSPNDAANVIAAHVGKGQISQFIEGLNHYFKELGLSHTHFMNPHGLHHPMHRTTAKEMALLTARALKEPLFRDIVHRSSYIFPQTNLEHERTLYQTNRLVKRGDSFYPYAIGVKTGTTKAAGKCLIAAAEKEGRLLIAALFGYAKREELYGDALCLFESAFAEKKMRIVLLPEGVHSFKGEVGGKERKLLGFIPTGLNYDFYPSEKESVHVQLEMDELQLPVEKGEKIGRLLIKNNEQQLLGEAAIFAAKKIRPLWGQFIKQTLVRKESGWLGLGLFFLFIINFMRKRFRRRAYR